MNANEIARRANALPEQFATRISQQTLRSLMEMRGGGEHGELVIELSAALSKNGAVVSGEEQQELRALLEAMHMPTVPVEQLTVRH
jgi:hypothetical protein